MSLDNIKTLAGRAMLRGWEVRTGIEQFAHVASKITGKNINIEWSQSISTAAVQGKGSTPTIYLQNIKDDERISRADFVKFVGYVVHEILHVAYTNFNINAQGNYLHRLHNAVEDAWIETRAIRENLFGNIEWVLHTLLRGMVEQARDAVQDWSDPAQYPFLLAVYARQYPIPALPLPAGLDPIFAEATRRIASVTSSRDTLKIAEWVYTQLQQIPPQQEEQQQEEQQQEEQQQEEGQEEGQQAGEPQEGEGKQAGADGEQQQDDEAGADGADTEGNGKQAGDQQDGDQQGANETSSPARAPQGEPTGGIEVEPCVTLGSGGTGGSFDRAGDMEKKPFTMEGRINSTDITVPGKLRFELRKLFERTAREDFEVNLKSGSINAGALFKAGNSDRLFRRRDEDEGIESAVVIVLDCSGSMHSKMSTVVGACVAIMKSLEDAGVEVAVLTFHSKTAVLKSFTQSSRSVMDTLGRLCPIGGTNDYHAIRVAHEMLIRHRAQRKVCLSITDGEGDVEATRRQCKAGTALGIQTIGVGIGYNVNRVYKDAVRVDNVQDLGGVAFSRLKAAA